MDIKELLQTWEKFAGVQLAPHEYRVRLPLHDAARVAALAEMYPLKTETEQKTLPKIEPHFLVSVIETTWFMLR